MIVESAGPSLVKGIEAILDLAAYQPIVETNSP